MNRNARAAVACAPAAAVALAALVFVDNDFLTIFEAADFAENLHTGERRRTDAHTGVARNQFDLIKGYLVAGIRSRHEVDPYFNSGRDAKAPSSIVNNCKSCHGKFGEKGAAKVSDSRRTCNLAGFRRKDITLPRLPQPYSQNAAWIPFNTSSPPNLSIASF